MQLSVFYMGLLASLAQQGLASYNLVDNYSGSNFFSSFSFFTQSDPTHGFVQYVDQGTAASKGYISAGNQVYMGVDHTNVASNSGRQSVRITSNKAYNHGLVILDAAHMPEGCGTWPAFWMVGPNWPNSGEIDIIEGVNDQNANAMTCHTSPGCTINNSGFTGRMVTSNCDINAAGQSNNAGCGIDATNTNTYGTGFNNNGGGVYATQWTSSAIQVWFFPRNGIPNDISNGVPNPSSWGTPLARFAGGCNIDSSFKNLQIVFDTTFCGDWAGNVWGSSSCASKASSCQAFVQNNPSAFAKAYWSVNSLKVYQDSGANSPNGMAQSEAPGAPTGVASSALTTVAPIPASSETIPFSSTASFWDGQGWGSAPEPTTAAPVPSTTAVAKAPAPQTTLATVPASTTAAPAPAPTTAAPAPTQSFWNGEGDPNASAPAPPASSSVSFWDGQGWDDAPVPTATAQPVVQQPGAKAPAPQTSKAPVFWDGFDLPSSRRRQARHLLSNQRLAGNVNLAL